MKYGFIGLAILSYLWSVVGVILSVRQQKKPLPASVADVYDAESYARWRAYRAERRRFGLVSGGISTLLIVAVLAFDLLPWGADALASLGVTGYAGDLCLMVAFCLLSALLDIVPSYISTFRIEEAYGFNRSTRKTFWGDFIKNTVITTLICAGLMSGADFFYRLMGKWLFVGLFACLALVGIVSASLSLPLQKLFYRFEPLPEGNLRDRLQELFDKNGYSVREIYVMNASKRTTRANAFCTGLGRYKKVALFDNLVDNYSEDEIVAVFAHELGHAKHRDVPVLLLLQIGIYAVLSLLIGGMIMWDAVSTALGFVSLNIAAVFILLITVVLGPVMTVVQIPFNLVSRHMERRADAFAAENGLGHALSAALKRISRDNFGDVNPHPLLSAMEDSHPSVGERIQLLERLGEGSPDADADDATD